MEQRSFQTQEMSDLNEISTTQTTVRNTLKSEATTQPPIPTEIASSDFTPASSFKYFIYNNALKVEILSEMLEIS